MIRFAFLASILAVVPIGANAADEAMQGFPPSKESQVTLMNAAEPPFNKWAFRNMGINPSVMVARGGEVFDVPVKLNPDLENLEFTYADKTQTVLDALTADDTDGFLVIKDGTVVYERYFGDFKEHHHHLWASSTKSLIGMAAGILVNQGKLDLSKPVRDYIPELANGVFGDHSVQTVLNMVSAIDYSEDYANLTPGSVHLEYFRRIGLTPSFDLMQADPTKSDVPRGTQRFLPKFEANKDLKPNTVFEYHSPNVDVIGWIIERQSGMPLHDFVRENIWTKLQTEHDAFFFTDIDFTPVATGGFNTTLRDFARLGLAVLDDGTLGGTRVFPEAWVRDIANVTDAQIEHTNRSVYGDKDAVTYDDKLIAYKNFWWIHDRDKGIFTARGVFGQTLYINRDANVVIATFGSAPTASNASRATYKAKLHAIEVLAASLK